MTSLEQIKCECGHINPAATEICESCGKPFDNETGLLNMRYEGAALRSKRKKRNIIDYIWNFFSSVKVGVILLFITLGASMLGTIYPQQMYIPSTAIPEIYYPEEYGFGGYLYVTLGLHNMYSSLWYGALLALIGISIIIASIDRFFPLYRALKNQRITQHHAFLERQRINAQTEIDNHEQVFEASKKELQKLKYNVKEEKDALMGEKHRFNRWGPYIVHIGLIILLVGALMRIIPGVTMDNYVWVRDGETRPIPGTQLYIESQGFVLKTYDEDKLPPGESQRLIPEDFITDVVLYDSAINSETGELELTKIKEQRIRVNHPLIFEGIKLYQSDYILNEFSEFSFRVEHKETEAILGEITVDLYQPDDHYDLGEGSYVQLKEYYPDFTLNDDNLPDTNSNIPNNPAFIFQVVTPEVPEGETSWLFIGRTVEMPGADNEYALRISNVEFNNVTGLMVRQERSLPIVYFGLAITMIGLMMCYYWQHRRIWIRREGSRLWIAGHTHKNWFGFKREVERVIDAAKLDIDKDTLDKEENA